MNSRSEKSSRGQTGSRSDSNANSSSSSYHIQRWGGQTCREEPWRQGDSKETRVDRMKERLNNFEKSARVLLATILARTT
ncbi:hypothetical protein F5B21DRAFT_413245 [Xylaria acuta]|nr:hypothetical protein F5B21DRAFT_413245 [Xylaria acuta]